jgi:hypothetical protein
MENPWTGTDAGQTLDLELDWADPILDPVLSRIQARLAAAHCRLELREEADGWVWEAVGHKAQTRRVFDSARLALEHADLYTRVWFPLLDEEPEELVRPSSPSPG